MRTCFCVTFATLTLFYFCEKRSKLLNYDKHLKHIHFDQLDRDLVLYE